jgi:Family of unknown function (DUF6962)
LQITEPTTMLTDYLLGGLALWFAWKLARQGRSSAQQPVVLWAVAFAGLAAAAFSGGTYHGFAEHLGSAALTISWKVVVYAIGTVSLALSCAATMAAFQGRPRRVLIGLAAAKFIAYAAWMVQHDDLIYAILDYAPALLYVLVLQAWAWSRHEESGPWIVAGVLVSFAAAAVQQSGFALHQYFNHNDLYHVIQMAGVYLLYRGGRLLGAVEPLGAPH